MMWVSGCGLGLLWGLRKVYVSATIAGLARFSASRRHGKSFEIIFECPLTVMVFLAILMGWRGNAAEH
jgi:hypothetical protein